MRPLAKRWTRRLLVAAFGCLLAGAGFSLYVGQRLVAPVPRVIGTPPSGLGGETVRFESGSGSRIAGWLTESEDASGAVLLLHAIRGDRRSMTDRARFLRDQGYHTLCIDFQAHGESPGARITLGHLESMDAAAAVAYLRKRYDPLPVVVVGTSLGGAAALLADYERPPDAMVVEAVFADVVTGVGNRLDMRFGRAGRMFAPLLTWQIPVFLGVGADRLDIVSAAARVDVPVFVIYGSEDRHARPAESEAIHQALAGPTAIWGVTGAAHVDFHRFAGADYEERVGRFIAKHLGDERLQAASSVGR